MRNTSTLLNFNRCASAQVLTDSAESGRSRDNAVWLPGEREPVKLFLSAVFSPREMNVTGFSMVLLFLTVSRTYAEYHRL